MSKNQPWLEFNYSIDQLGLWLKNFGFNNKNYHPKSTVIITDNQIFTSLKLLIDQNFLIEFSNIIISDQIIENIKFNNVEISSIEFADIVIEKNQSLWQDCQLLIAIGSGTITDLTKYIAQTIGIDFISIPSATSMNGYLSPTASLSKNNYKKSISCRQAIAVFADWQLINTAPKRLNLAGIADSLAFYSCQFDWLFAHHILKQNINHDSIKLVAKAIEDFYYDYHRYSITDQNIIKKLLIILLEMGKAMNLDQSSRPASQSEHLIAHSLTMQMPNIANNMYHGEHIALPLPLSLMIQEKMLTKSAIKMLDLDYPFFTMQQFFGEKIAKEAEEEFCTKANIIRKWQENDNQSTLLANQNNNWQWFRDNMLNGKIGYYKNSQEIFKIFEHFQINYKIAELTNLNSESVANIVNLARFLRNRITCLDFTI